MGNRGRDGDGDGKECGIGWGRRDWVLCLAVVLMAGRYGWWLWMFWRTRGISMVLDKSALDRESGK